MYIYIIYTIIIQTYIIWDKKKHKLLSSLFYTSTLGNYKPGNSLWPFLGWWKSDHKTGVFSDLQLPTAISICILRPSHPDARHRRCACVEWRWSPGRSPRQGTKFRPTKKTDSLPPTGTKKRMTGWKKRIPWIKTRYYVFSLYLLLNMMIFPLSCCLLLSAGDFLLYMLSYSPTKHVMLVFWRVPWVHDFV